MIENISLEIILIFIVTFLLFVIFILLSKKEKVSDEKTLKLLQDQIIALNKNIDFKLSENNKNNVKQSQINSDISRESSKKIEEITRKLTSLEETNKQIKDIWKGLEGLERVLKSPKQRGILWEYFLENVLKNILPPENYKLQYSFSDATIVDWVIFVKEKIIPIDSKFSLENYNKFISEENPALKEVYAKDFRNDLKKRIDETSKYIKPEEGTMEFAFMFIASEWIYYDLLINKVWNPSIDLIEYAFKEKRVIIVSPTSFYAYLQTVMQWLRALQIEEKALEIKKHVEKLGKHLQNYEESLVKLGNSLWATVNHYNAWYKKFNLVEKDILKIEDKNKETDINIIQIDKPDIN